MTGHQPRKLWVATAAAALVASGLACQGAGASVVDYAAYGLDDVPPYWVCATATPMPTSTKAPCACVCDGSRGIDECLGAVGLCVGPDEHWGLECPPWPPTPRPTPTRFVMVGGPFRLHQRIWMPIRPTVAPEPSLGSTLAPPGGGQVGILLTSWTHHPAHRFDFEVTNASASPVDVDLPSQVFVRCGNGRAFAADRDEYAERELDYPDSHLGPGETRRVSVPIRYEGECPDPVLGILTSPYLSSVGSQVPGARVVTGADTALYIDYRSTVSGECSATQEAPLGAPYPEVEAPPPEPDREDYAYANVMDGAAAGHRSDKVPVTMPPCLRITRGFGCDAFPTGVSGGDRCPPDAPYWHTGVDYSCPRGTPVRTPMGGALVHSSSTGYGRLAMVILSEQGQTLEMYFAHLASFAQSDVCRRGGICHAGSRVGVVGSSGFSTGPHLHWEMRVNDLPVDPFLYYGGSAGSGRPAAASHASGRPVAGRNPGAAALASPARVPPSPEPAATRRPRNRYPLTLRVRDAAGAGVARAQIRLQGIDGENEVAACTSDSRGLCALSLPSGVYRIRLAGEIDGRRIDAVGAPNVRAMEGDGLEYAYGPLALWHEGPGSTVGMVLTGDGSGVLHPLIDADPRGAAPQPLDPVEDLPRTTPTATAADQAPYDTLMPEDAHRRPARLAVGLVSLAAALGLLTFAYYVSRREAR